MEVESYKLIEIAFKVWGVKPHEAFGNGNAWGNSNIPHARYLAFKLLSEYNGMIGSEIGQIFNCGRATVNSGLKRMDDVISTENGTWSYITMRKKYFEALSTISGN